MKYFPKALIFLALSVLVGSGASAGQRISLTDKTALQAAMQQHIDRNLVDGAYLQLDARSGQVHALHPYKPHPVILKMGAYFVLCSDFRDDKGKTVNVDFYMARRGRSYVVFHKAVDTDNLVTRLMKEGRAERVD